VPKDITGALTKNWGVKVQLERIRYGVRFFPQV
jgi:hypothetical protein